MFQFWTEVVSSLEAKYKPLDLISTEEDAFSSFSEYEDKLLGEGETWNEEESLQNDDLIEEEEEEEDDESKVFLTVNNMVFVGTESEEFLMMNGWIVHKTTVDQKIYYSMLDIIQAIYIRKETRKRLDRREASQMLKSIRDYHKLINEEETIGMRMYNSSKETAFITHQGIKEIFKHPRKSGNVTIVYILFPQDLDFF